MSQEHKCTNFKGTFKWDKSFEELVNEYPNYENIYPTSQGGEIELAPYESMDTVSLFWQKDGYVHVYATISDSENGGKPATLQDAKKFLDFVLVHCDDLHVLNE